MIEKVEGIILSETPYGETSKIINVLTKEHGMIGIIAKGAKQLKSKLRAVTDRFIYGYFYIYYKENKLSQLTQVDIINNYDNIKKDITLISYMTYLADLTKQVIKEKYDLQLLNNLIITLDKMNKGLDPLILTNIIELKDLDYLGIGLNLDACIKCGSKTNIVTIDPDEGGYICQNCYTNQFLVDLKTIKMIRLYYYIDISTITKIDVSAKIKKEINIFLERYYERYSGLYLKSKEFLNNIINE